MGKKIQKAFDKIMDVAGLSERMFVSIKAGIPSAYANKIPDDYKNLTLMKQAVNTVFDDVADPEIRSKKNEVLALLN